VVHETSVSTSVQLLHRSRSSRDVLVPSLHMFRTRLALSQDNLAEKAKVGRATIARGERGLPVRPSSVRKLAKALGVKPWDLQRPPESD
jgi:transcriptional regulator with XRE-family HTH domain